MTRDSYYPINAAVTDISAWVWMTGRRTKDSAANVGGIKNWPTISKRPLMSA